MQKVKISDISLVALLPSFVTMFALCLGTTSIRYALEAKFDIAAALIIVASIMDGLDGRLARLLNSTSNFGAQLDSLADLVSFGVAPGILMYLWSLHEISAKGLGWAVALLYITCSAFRLARFNVQSSSDIEKKNQNFFIGVPMPAAAALVLLPLLVTFNIIDYKMPSHFVAIYVAIIGSLMVSRIPTFSGKKVSIKKAYVLPLLIVTGLVMAGVLIDPWFILPFIGFGYMISLPVGVFCYYRSGQEKQVSKQGNKNSSGSLDVTK